MYGDARRGRQADNVKGSWVDRMYVRWVNKADVEEREMD